MMRACAWEVLLLIAINERVRFVDTDMMGVVHHANYFKWFEVARVAYLRAAGILLLDMMQDGYLFPISDVRCAYKEPARYDDCLEISARMLELSRAKMVFSYQVRREKDKAILAEGFTINVFTNAQGQVARLPAKYYEPLRAFYDVEVAAGAAGGQ